MLLLGSVSCDRITNSYKAQDLNLNYLVKGGVSQLSNNANKVSFTLFAKTKSQLRVKQMSPKHSMQTILNVTNDKNKL